MYGNGGCIGDVALIHAGVLENVQRNRIEHVSLPKHSGKSRYHEQQEIVSNQRIQQQSDQLSNVIVFMCDCRNFAVIGFSGPAPVSIYPRPCSATSSFGAKTDHVSHVFQK